ncbi:hypothetical protein RJ639_009276 [Escallonia herrerae]|uniref:AN1-type domain-containing protein n=1 Tax=Escallonia herrerae TaxID=1293975 RepID=A0AA88VUW0_9ASTE|nr:hypothetical protein RJ639_009276 [Escallonia herrerae]
MGGGTEAFPDLGMHCQYSDCHQLDFLPFKCDGCSKPEGRGLRNLFEIETTGKDEESEKAVLERHEKSGDCDPKKKKKPTCQVRRCREILTFSNTSSCKTCQIKFCLKHRFPADHACKPNSSSTAAGVKEANMFLVALASRNGNNGCASKARRPSSPPSTTSVKAC